MASNHFSGGCQCGAVRYEVDVDISRTVTCNCSRCRKLGAILAFTPATAFRLLSGEGAMTDYQFNIKAIHHLFCATCGIQSFARGKGPDGTEMVAVNVRCLDEVDIGALQPVAHDGASM